MFDLERLNELQYSEGNAGFRTVLVSEADHPFWEHWWPQGHMIGWEHSFVHEIHHLLTAIRDDTDVAPHGATLEDGYRAAEICDAMLRSAEQGGARAGQLPLTPGEGPERSRLGPSGAGHALSGGFDGAQAPFPFPRRIAARPAPRAPPVSNEQPTTAADCPLPELPSLSPPTLLAAVACYAIPVAASSGPQPWDDGVVRYYDDAAPRPHRHHRRPALERLGRARAADRRSSRADEADVVFTVDDDEAARGVRHGLPRLHDVDRPAVGAGRWRCCWPAS